MSDSFTPYALPRKGSAFSVCLPEPPLTANCSVLVVEPDMTPRSDRERRLLGANYTVTIVREVREIVRLRFEEPLALAVVNDLLGPSALRAAAESVRQQWPSAKILVIGRAVPTLEDYLYDDAISHHHDGTGFLGKLQMLVSSAAKNVRDGDPPKRLDAKPVRLNAERNMPGGIYRMRAAR